MTLQQFARKAGISDSTLQRLESGEQNITLQTLEKILGNLKC
jgi:transcriptional regulator with XRE-family HTH domain